MTRPSSTATFVVVNLAAENVNESRVFENKLSGLFAAGDGEFVLSFSHNGSSWLARF